jgi:hypothetical protein
VRARLAGHADRAPRAPGQEASGNLAGIFMPLLSKDDNIPPA